MGCTSSSPAAAAVDKVAAPQPDGNNNSNNAVHKKKERQVTAGTEAMTTPSVAVSPDIESSHYDIASTISYFQPTYSSGPNPKTVGSLSIRYACHSQRGRDPDHPSKQNQDCFGHHYNKQSAFFAVYDGHGPVGEQCSHYVRDKLPQLLKTNIQKIQSKSKSNKSQQSSESEQSVAVKDVDDIHAALHDACVTVNNDLRSCEDINDNYSGTTSVGVFLHDSRITICNVGDSRIVLGCSPGTGESGRVQAQAIPLSKDHTPYREDEANRCIGYGARILSFGQIDPSTKEGDPIDEEIEDPPRVWAQEGHYPGTAFTRSMGDSIAEKFGVYAEPELLTLPISPNERLLVLASDGVFDVMSNQEAVNIAFHLRNAPALAARAIIEQSHKEWLLNDDCCEEQANYDDMTVVVIYLDHPDHVVDVSDVSGDMANVAEVSHAPLPRMGKRVRQKTLRNLEEMKC